MRYAQGLFGDIFPQQLSTECLTPTFIHFKQGNAGLGLYLFDNWKLSEHSMSDHSYDEHSGFAVRALSLSLALVLDLLHLVPWKYLTRRRCSSVIATVSRIFRIWCYDCVVIILAMVYRFSFKRSSHYAKSWAGLVVVTKGHASAANRLIRYSTSVLITSTGTLYL